MSAREAITYHVRFKGSASYLVEATDAIDALSRASELHSLATGISLEAICRMTVEARPYANIDLPSEG